MEENNNVHSKRVKAGKRTYFIDIKETRSGGFYLSVSESRRNFNEDGSNTYTKSKLFVYPEDISRFTQAVTEAFNKMKSLMPSYDFERFERRDAERDERQQEETNE